MRSLPLTLTLALLGAGASACGDVASEDPAQHQDAGESDSGTDANPEPDDHLRVERQVLTDALDRVTIAEVRTSQPSWIALYELADPWAPESPGNLLTTQLLEAGEHTDIELRTARDLGDSEFLLARLHLDAPTDGAFGYNAADESPDDPPARNAEGEDVATVVEIRVPSAGLHAESQTLDLSTQVTLRSMNTDRPALVAIYDADDTLIASASFGPGLYEILPITLNRPIDAAGETLRARLFEDVDENQALDEAIDLPRTNADASPVDMVFDATHADPADPAPALRFQVSNLGPNAYLFESAEPAAFTSSISDPQEWNPTLTLKRGWRYEIHNTSINVHPFDLLDLGEERADDVVLLSQASGLNPAPENDPQVAWIEDGPLMRFTLAGALLPDADAPSLTGYRCAVAGHPDMRGAIVVED